MHIKERFNLNNANGFIAYPLREYLPYSESRWNRVEYHTIDLKVLHTKNNLMRNILIFDYIHKGN